MEKIFFGNKFYWLFFIYSLFYAQSPPSCSGSWGPPIVNQSFGQGDAFSKWYGPLSAYAPGATTSTIFVGAAGPPGGYLQDGYSGLVKSPDVNGFINSSDHTGNTNGLMLLVNAPSTASTVFFEDVMNNLCPNTTLKLSIWILNVNHPGTCSPHYQLPNLTLRAIDIVTGNILGSPSTGDIPIDSKWKEFHIIFNNASSSSVKFKL